MPALRFRVWGFPVRVDATFLLLVLFALDRPAALLVVWAAVVFVSILTHELGHAFAFRRFGQDAEVVVWGFGGYTRGSGTPPLTRRQEIVVSLAGSITGLALLGLPGWLGREAVLRSESFVSYELWVGLDDLVWVNVAWGVLNLLPLLPFDGGRVASAILEGLWGRAGWTAARYLSAATATVLAVLAIRVGMGWGAVVAVFVVGNSLNELTRRRDDPLVDRLAEGYLALERRDPEEGVRIAYALLDRARSRPLRAAAAELLAWSHLLAGRPADGRKALAIVRDERPSEHLTAGFALSEGKGDEAIDRAARALVPGPAPPVVALADLVASAGVAVELGDRLLSEPGDEGPAAAALLTHRLHTAGRYEDAVSLGQRLYADGRLAKGLIAFNVACGLVLDGDRSGALAWLERAVADGLSDTALLDGDADLEELRSDPRFAELRARASRTTSGDPRRGPERAS